MEGSMAGTKPSIVAAFIIACGLAGLAPTAAMAQFPIPMIPNFNFGPQHYRGGGSQHYSTHSHSHQSEDKAPEKVDKSKEKDATQPDPTATTSSAPRTQQTAGPPPSHDAVPSGGSGTPASPPPAPPAKNDDQPAFAPSR
jgi:hypothetical protein